MIPPSPGARHRWAAWSLIAAGAAAGGLWLVFTTSHGPTSYNEDRAILGIGMHGWGMLLGVVPNALLLAGLVGLRASLLAGAGRGAGIPLEVSDRFGGYRIYGALAHLATGIGWVLAGVVALRASGAGELERLHQRQRIDRDAAEALIGLVGQRPVGDEEASQRQVAQVPEVPPGADRAPPRRRSAHRRGARAG